VNARATAWGAYKQLTETLRARIASDEFQPGAMLPPESALCRQYGMARNTVRRALDQLGEEGLITTIPGKGRVKRDLTDKPKSAAPLYHDVAAELRDLIASGAWAPGQKLPSESALAEQYRVARGTIRQALAELEGAGLAETVRGKGRFVRAAH
jgi:DNA-binding GntR family transcriptional regulator